MTGNDDAWPLRDSRVGSHTVAAGTSSFTELTSSFSARIADLQQLVCFRVEGAANVMQRVRGESSTPACFLHIMPLELQQTRAAAEQNRWSRLLHAPHLPTITDSVKGIFLRDIQGIEASVRALEVLFEELRAKTQHELAAMPRVRRSNSSQCSTRSSPTITLFALKIHCTTYSA
jgi:hypothetical protein